MTLMRWRHEGDWSQLQIVESAVTVSGGYRRDRAKHPDGAFALDDGRPVPRPTAPEPLVRDSRNDELGAPGPPARRGSSIVAATSHQAS